MKRLLFLGAAAIAILFGFSACSEKELHEETISDIRFTLDSYLDEDASGSLETKTGINGNAFIWSPNDTVGIFPNAGSQIYFSMEIGANASSASFDGGGWSLRNGYSYWSYYPFVGDIYLDRTKIPVAYDGQIQSGNDSSDHIGDYDFLYTDRCSPVNDALMFAFHHLDCILKPRVTLPAGTYTKVEITAPTSIFVSSGHYDLTSSAPSVDVSSEGTTLTDKLTLLLDDVTFTEPTELVGYLMAYPVDVSNVELTVTVYTDQDRKYAYKYTRTSSFAHGSIHNLRGEVDWNEGDVNQDPYLTFRSEGTSTLALNTTGTVTGTFQYTLGDPKNDFAIWRTLSSTGVEFTSGNPIYVRGKRTSENNNGSYLTFSISGDYVSVEGNILAIKDYTDMSCTTMDFDGCSELFKNCSKLKDASKLILSPKTLSAGSYDDMFYDCTGLTAAPELPATTLGIACYSGMFAGCTGLTAAPELPATTLADWCYYGMFARCTGLTATPALPATTLTEMCYYSMFNGCTGLTAAPELPATTLADQCYTFMFANCTGLTAAPELPATTLTEQCYAWMFFCCTGLTAAPELPATTLAEECYLNMFNGCSKLNYVKAMFTDMTSTYCTYDWLDGVSSTGTFVKNSAATWNVSGASGIPTGWTVVMEGGVDDVNRDPYLTFRSEGTSTLGLNTTGTVTGTFEYTLGDPKSSSTVWQTLSSTDVEFTSENPIYVRGIRTSENTSSSYLTFSINGDYASVEGNILAIKSYTDMSCTTMGAYGCYALFYNCTKLRDASKLILSPQTVSNFSYGVMFYGCTGLTAAPALPATTLNPGCYSSMFRGCTGLTAAPALPATTLANTCYFKMFQDCRGLTSAPALPATTLANMCYYEMFYQCIGLTSAPALPATTLGAQCYYRMFFKCTGLTAAPALPATTLKSGCYESMFQGCTKLTTAPVLPATTLADNSYAWMFYGCSKLNYVKALCTDMTATNCTYNWLSGVSSTGTFVKNSAATWDESGVSGIPTGWTVELADN